MSQRLPILPAVLLAASLSCSVRPVPPSEPWHELNPAGDFSRGASLLVGSGTLDAGNVHLPAVMVSTTITDPQGNRFFRPCSGVLIHPRLVITAGHCVCIPRTPASRDGVPDEKAPVPSKRPLLTRARAVHGVRLTGIIDKDATCARVTTVTTLVYEATSPEEGQSARISDHPGDVVIHPDLKLISGVSQGRTEVVWNNTDLAAIMLKKPVRLDFQPIALADSEVRVNDAIVMVGYGPGDSSKPYGDRQFGESKVTRLILLETGSMVFGAETPSLSDRKGSAHAEPGDSGGACVKRDKPHVLVGITTMGAHTTTGGKLSLFTSIYPHRQWLLELIERAKKS